MTAFDYKRSPVYNPTYSVSGEIDKGYFVNPDYKNDIDDHSNASLSLTRNKQNWSIGLFVNDIALGMSLGGSTAQSRTLRQFYAHNLTLPQMTVTCQTRSSYEYSYIAEYIRLTQLILTSNYNTAATDNKDLIVFKLDSHKQRDRKGNLAPNETRNKHALAVTYRGPDGKEIVSAKAAWGNLMGDRMGFQVYCYITGVTRAVQVGQNAYQFSFGVEIVDKEWGLPFTSNDQAIDQVEGIQWTYEQLNNAAANGISYVSNPNITVGTVKPKKKKTSGANSTPPPNVIPSSWIKPPTTTQFYNQPINSGLTASNNGF